MAYILTNKYSLISKPILVFFLHYPFVYRYFLVSINRLGKVGKILLKISILKQ